MLALTGYFLWALYNPDVKRVSNQRTQEFSVRESNFIEKFKPVAFEGVILKVKEFTKIRGDRNYLMKLALKPVDSLQYDFESNYFVREGDSEIVMVMKSINFGDYYLRIGDTIQKIAGEDSLILKYSWPQRKIRVEKQEIESSIFDDYHIKDIEW